MAKKTQIEKVIDELEAKRTAARAKFAADDAALALAIQALHGGIVRRVRKPKAVERSERPSLASA